jgi:D-sedoheptulose 7-phosphate isomerase
MKELTKSIFQEFIKSNPTLEGIKNDILEAYYAMFNSFKSGNRLYTCGNGGSASDSEHIVGELMKSFRIPRPLPEEDVIAIVAEYPEDAEYLISKLQRGLSSVALVSNTVLFTALCNDVDPDIAFAQQIYAYGKKGDVLLAISTSGAAKNVINAAKVANALGIVTIGLTKETGGALIDLCRICVKVSARDTYAVQELHLPVYHAWCAMLESEFFS